MKNYPLWKSLLVILVIFTSIIFTIPSIIYSEEPSNWFLEKKINLGLDLQGGSYLLLQVESDVLFKEELENDTMISRHLKDLSERLLEQNLVRIIEPYSRVEIAYVAEQIKLPLLKVEAKMSQMILDGKFSGILDQGKGHLLVFDDNSSDKTYEHSLKTIKKMDEVVESLFLRAKQIQTA